MPNKPRSTITIARALKEAGITNSNDRRAFMEGGDLREKVAGILANNPKLQEELAHTMGIGDTIIGHFHEMMEKDFKEPDILCHELINFFQTHGNIHLNIHEVKDTSVRSFHPGDKEERVQDISTLFSSSQLINFANEKNLLLTENEEIYEVIEGNGGRLCFKIKTPVGTTLILSFGDKDTQKSEIVKILKLFKKTGLLQRIKEKLKHIQTTYTDHLTGLYNQHYIQSTIEKNSPYSVIFLDLDKFKEYNDTYGHNEGDILLQDMAKILQSSVRQNDKVCRKGGDEFIIFMDGCNLQEEINKVAERIKEKVNALNNSKHKIFNNPDIPYSPISITSGYAIWDNEDTLEDILRRADKEMFRHKIEGGSEGELYRLIEKLNRFSFEKKTKAISGLLAADPDLRRKIFNLLSIMNTED